MKKLINLYPFFLFLFGMLMFMGCERDDKDISAVNEITDKPSLKCVNVAETNLRHVMLFEFDDNTSPVIIRGFITALCAFKDSIKEVKEIEWGKNFNYSSNSPYSYCFIVSFNSMDDFLLYLGNPVHLNFINTWLNPNIKDVIAFDYIATDIKYSKTFDHKAIRELVLFKYIDNLTTGDINKVTSAFISLPNEVRPIRKFEWGSELQLLGLNKGFNDAFLLTFKHPQDFYFYSLCPPVKYFFKNIANPNTEQIIKVDYYNEN